MSDHRNPTAPHQQRRLVVRPHQYMPGEDDRCTTCDLPKGNRHHVDPITDDRDARILGEHEGDDR